MEKIIYLCTEFQNTIAMIDNPYLISGRGKVGTIVTYVRNGVQITRAYQPVVYNPRTVRQQLSRAKMSLASEYARGFSRILKIGFGGMIGEGVSARNIFIGKAVPVENGVITGTTPVGIRFNMEAIAVSDGNIPNVAFGAVDYDTPQRIEVLVSSVTDLEPYMGDERYSYGIYLFAARADDPALHNTYALASVVNTVADLRNVESVAMEVPSSWQGQRVYVYAFIKQIPEARNGILTAVPPTRYPGDASPTVYLGSGTVA